MSEKSLEFPATLDSLPEIRQFVENVAEECPPGLLDTYDIKLAIEEIVTNTILHGYQGRAGKIEVSIVCEGETLTIRLRDNAPPFDPTSVPPPDLTRPLRGRPIGGWGLYVARQAIDEMVHRTLPDGGNELVLIKTCHPG